MKDHVANEGKRTKRMLEKIGWTVDYNEHTRQYTASHERTDQLIRFKSAVNTQRVLDEARQALGLPPVRTTSGVTRKARLAKSREHRRQMSKEAAWRQALADLHVTEEVERGSTLVSKDVRRHYDDLSLTTTYTSIVQAQQHGLTGRDIQEALVRPLGVFEGYNDCVRYAGPKCHVIVNPFGYIVSVNPV